MNSILPGAGGCSHDRAQRELITGPCDWTAEVIAVLARIRADGRMTPACCSTTCRPYYFIHSPPLLEACREYRDQAQSPSVRHALSRGRTGRRCHAGDGGRDLFRQGTVAGRHPSGSPIFPLSSRMPVGGPESGRALPPRPSARARTGWRGDTLLIDQGSSSPSSAPAAVTPAAAARPRRAGLKRAAPAHVSRAPVMPPAKPPR